MKVMLGVIIGAAIALAAWFAVGKYNASPSARRAASSLQSPSGSSDEFADVDSELATTQRNLDDAARAEARPASQPLAGAGDVPPLEGNPDLGPDVNPVGERVDAETDALADRLNGDAAGIERRVEARVEKLERKAEAPTN